MKGIDNGLQNYGATSSTDRPKLTKQEKVEYSDTVRGAADAFKMLKDKKEIVNPENRHSISSETGLFEDIQQKREEIEENIIKYLTDGEQDIEAVFKDMNPITRTLFEGFCFVNAACEVACCARNHNLDYESIQAACSDEIDGSQSSDDRQRFYEDILKKHSEEKLKMQEILDSNPTKIQATQARARFVNTVRALQRQASSTENK